MLAIVDRTAGVDSAPVAGRNNQVTGYGYGGDFRGGSVGVSTALARSTAR